MCLRIEFRVPSTCDPLVDATISVARYKMSWDCSVITHKLTKKPYTFMRFNTIQDLNTAD